MDKDSLIQGLRERIATLEAERAQWQMLLAAILYQYGDLRISQKTRREVPLKPVILVSEDRARGEVILSLGPIPFK